MTGVGEPAGSRPAPAAEVGDAGTDQVRHVVALMAQLRRQCPWDARQTHASLAPYAIEEAHELAEAAETGDRDGLREELGDLLLQVVFHAAVAGEHETQPFGLDDVAATLAEKLVRRHPHVFAPSADGPLSRREVEVAWQRIKEAEASTREQSAPDDSDVLAGIPPTLPALGRAQQAARRLRRRGEGTAALLDGPAGAGRDLMALVLRAEGEGLDAEATLRGYLRELPGRPPATG